MTTFVALLRGINVGGANKVPMAELKKIVLAMGGTQPETYIASGNLIFDTDLGDPTDELRNALKTNLNVDVPILVLTAPEFRNIVATSPFHDVEGKLAHIWFTFATPQPNQTLRDDKIAVDEDLLISKNAGYLHAPSGIGRSKLADKMTKVLGVDATARNMRTCKTLIQMLDARA